jgi:uncharacterized protein
MKDLSTLAWSEMKEMLDKRGFVHIPGILSRDECVELRERFGDGSLFRSVIEMERYRFGKGSYKYFGYPLPSLVETLRENFYSKLAPIANEWMEKLRSEVRFPHTLQELLSLCAIRQQTRPTPLMLRYEVGGYNTLHQDLYGEVYFPFQVVLPLSEAGKDYEGGEFVLVEQIPRAQSRAQVIRPMQGDAVIFTTNFRPAQGAKGFYRATMKHGISEVSLGVRYALGVIFHDAR